MKYRKAAAALRPGGCAAVFWNAQIETPQEGSFFVRVEDCYRRHGPHMVVPWRTAADLPNAAERGFLDTGLMDDVAALHYPWTERYSTGRYLNVLQTFSGHIALPDDVRARLLEDIGRLIDREFGGEVEKHWITVLQCARKR
ncbi:MAG: hypothetical protein FJ315_07240 [SAR202 cluster bacterium]|nr:hypothetical protein [SAR202 cluster bacterium]